MRGFQAGNIDAIRSERVVCTISAGNLRVKAFQVVFSDDGGLYIAFPYFLHRTGILCASHIPATEALDTSLKPTWRGALTSLLHHLGFD
jgi:hypothetical protein